MEVDPSNNDNLPLLTMSLELDNGLTEQINIYRNSDPETLAFEFCKEHNLELDSVNYLKEQIQKLLNETKEAEEEEDEDEEEQIEEVYEDEGTEDNRYEVKGQDDIKRREEEIHQLTENNQIDDDIEIGEEEDEEGGEGEDEDEGKGDDDVGGVNDNDNGSNNNNATIPENPEDEKDVQEEGDNVNVNVVKNETPLKIEDLLHSGKNEYKQHSINDKEDVHEPLTNEIIEDHNQQEEEQEEQYDVIKEHDEETNSFHKDNIEIQEIQDLEDNNDEQYNNDDNDNDTNNNIHNFQENQPKELEDEDYNNINEDNILHNNTTNNNNPSLPPSNTNIIIEEHKQPSSKDNNNNNDHPSPQQQNHPQDSLENTEQDDELPISQDNNNNNNYVQPYRHNHHHHTDEYEDDNDNDAQMVHHTQPLHHQMEDNIHSGNNNNTHHTASNTIKNNNNIFNRLFQDAEIKRVMPKRPCHFNNRNNNNNNNHNTNNSLSKYNSNNTNNSAANNNSSGNTNNNTKPKKQTTTTTNNNNYGEYLYEQHKLHKQEQLHRNEEDKRESQNKELTHCTFKPNINNDAFTSNNNNNNSNINNYNYYYNGKQVQTIGTNNTSIRPRTPMTRAEKLEKEFNEKHTFKPQINSGYITELNFLERQALHMQKCKDNIENYKQMLHQQQQQQFDNAQQQRKCRSKPRTPCYTANNARCGVGGEYTSTTFANTNVFDRNYNYANQYKKKLIELTNMYNNNINNSKTNPNTTNTQFNVNNNKIIDRVNCEAFSNLFKVLDSDEDGVISQMHMNTKKLSPEVYRIIEPIINEIKEENQKLEESDFVDAMCNLYEDIRYYDRHLLINTFKNIKNTKIKQHSTNNNNTCSFNHNYKNNNNVIRKGINMDHQRKDGRMLVYKNEDKKYNTNYTFKPVINANAHKYAKRYDEKQQQMFNKYLSLYNSSSNKFNSNREKGYINRAEYFKDNNNSNNNNMNFNSLRNCTFDNYVKNLH